MATLLRVLGGISFLVSLVVAYLTYSVMGVLQTPALQGMEITLQESTNWAAVGASLAFVLQGAMAAAITFALASLLDYAYPPSPDSDW